MSKPLPFETLPTRAIVDAPYPGARSQSHPLSPSTLPSTQSVSSKSIQPQQKPLVTREVRELDAEQGKRILALIYERNGSIATKVQSMKRPGEGGTHQPSYYMSKEGSTKSEKKSELDLLDRVNDYLCIGSTRSIKHIDRDLLVANNITLNDLVSICDIGITDLWSSGIVTCVKDLRALNFQMNDVVIKRERFQAQQLADLFGLNYEKLRKMKGVEFGVIDLLTCHFATNELSALSFSFDRMIRKHELNNIQLKSLKHSLCDLITLGFQKEHLEILDISDEQAIQEFKWDAKEYATFVKS